MVMPSLRDLELRHLVALDAVAAEGTFGRAAVRLGYTQSAVSQQIASLERLVGGSLFDRPGGPRPVELTPLGKLVLAHAREIIDRVDAAGEAVDRFHAGESGASTSGRSRACRTCCCRRSWPACAASYPALDIRLFEDEDKDDGPGTGGRGELDVSFCVGQRAADLESIVLLDDPFVLVARRGDLPRRARTRPTSSTARRWSATPPGCARRTSRTVCAPAASTPTFVFRTYDNGAQLAMVRAGMGWAVMPLLAVDTRDPAIDVRPLQPPIPPRQVCLAWRRDRTLSPVAERLIELARDVAADLRQLPPQRLTCGSSSTAPAPSAGSSAGGCSSTATTSCCRPRRPRRRHRRARAHRPVAGGLGHAAACRWSATPAS